MKGEGKEEGGREEGEGRREGGGREGGGRREKGGRRKKVEGIKREREEGFWDSSADRCARARAPGVRSGGLGLKCGQVCAGRGRQVCTKTRVFDRPSYSKSMREVSGTRPYNIMKYCVDMISYSDIYKDGRATAGAISSEFRLVHIVRNIQIMSKLFVF